MEGVSKKMDELIELAARVGELLKGKGWTLGTAESCTGGLIGHLLTEIPGSSAYFRGGIVAYANEVKRDLLGVPQELLTAHGAASCQVAGAMARGVRELLHTDLGIAVTGIAGPTGWTPKKPVGTVYIGLSSPMGNQVEHHVWNADRQGNKLLSAEAALALLEGLLMS
jgi:PncC family amidohydrolase